jgi:hypothetical protein
MRSLLTIFFCALVSSSALAREVFELKQMNGENAGQMFRSSDYPGPVWVYEFYFNTCPYCNDNAPMIDRLSEQFSSELRVHVLDIGRDCRDSDYRSWLGKHNPNHPVLNDCNQALINKHQIRGYPTTVIVDCNGKVQFRNEGAFSSGEYERAAAAIEEALNQPCRTPIP